MSIDFIIDESDEILGLKIITPSVHYESRGSIWTSYNTSKVGQILPNGLSFKHDKFSLSKNNVLRGIHGDHKSWKLISCAYGKIFQVIVDMRKTSKTYLKWQSFELGEESRSMIMIPPGMGNAFYVTSDTALYHYKLAYNGEYVDADEQFTVAWNDPRLKIQWPTDDPILSDRDSRL